MGSVSSHGFCECRDVVNRVLHADAEDVAMQVSGHDEMEQRPLEVCRAIRIKRSPEKEKSSSSVRAKVEDKDGGSYQGEWLGSWRHGKGTQLWPSGASYSGQWVYDLPHGHGRLEQGDIYDGQWKQGKVPVLNR